MAPAWMSMLFSIGMAVGPALVYADQGISIYRKKDSTGFSRDVCAILLISNITRCFFWLGRRFEFPLLMQSVLLILSQLALLHICLLYRPTLSPEDLGNSTRPFKFWQWTTYGQYIEFLAAQILCLTIVFLIFSRFDVFISILGFAALGLESTLPIPQLISNFKNKSLYGFRSSTLIGWVGGDTFKTVYFFLQDSPLPFKVCAIFQLSIDCSIVVQRFMYGDTPPATVLPEDDIEESLRLELEA
ncbi:hypothetical protein SISSUDRAFT_1070555 [Sistotremastrum suecicum HHB10207 ss-3]|uniref:PQ-loop-domain-containing protein n=1 Tax=Sistotremastrum suecicum HHB10207 ss-3 TaxID=1314776 RepID=A0A166EB47_9AGAM|nr:hypothetical protein SISSUDRAFT_1070555 [Sistotremastrum suecicum HHB10207 ss-3]